jgi:hypothetical protein
VHPQAKIKRKSQPLALKFGVIHKKLAIPIADFCLRLREPSGSERLLRNSEFKTYEKKTFPWRNLPRSQRKRGQAVRRIPHPPPGFGSVR